MTMTGIIESPDVHFEKTDMKPDPLEEKASKGHELHLSTYKDITIEEHAYRKQGDEAKQLFTYDQSLERMIKAGYYRHLRPTETFGLLIDSIEGTLNPELQSIDDDMFQSYGEWVSMAFERKGDILTAYLDPVGLAWNKKKRDYVKENFSYAEKKEFGIAGMQSNSWISLSKINPELILYLYGRPFEELPAEIRQTAFLYLPKEGMVRPVAHGSNDDYLDLSADYDQRASRGVRETQPPKKTKTS